MLAATRGAREVERTGQRDWAPAPAAAARNSQRRVSPPIDTSWKKRWTKLSARRSGIDRRPAWREAVAELGRKAQGVPRQAQERAQAEAREESRQACAIRTEEGQGQGRAPRHQERVEEVVVGVRAEGEPEHRPRRTASALEHVDQCVDPAECDQRQERVHAQVGRELDVQRRGRDQGGRRRSRSRRGEPAGEAPGAEHRQQAVGDGGDAQAVLGFAGDAAHEPQDREGERRVVVVQEASEEGVPARGLRVEQAVEVVEVQARPEGVQAPEQEREEQHRRARDDAGRATHARRCGVP